MGMFLLGMLAGAVLTIGILAAGVVLLGGRLECDD